MPLNHAQPKKSPLSGGSSSSAPAPITLSRYRGRQNRMVSAEAVENKQIAYQQSHHKKIYNASVSSSEASIDSESLRTQTSISSAGSGSSWLEDDKKQASKLTRIRSTHCLAQTGKATRQTKEVSSLKIDLNAEAYLRRSTSHEPSSPATVKGGVIEDMDVTPTRQTIRRVKRNSINSEAIIDDKLDADKPSSATRDHSRPVSKLVLPSDLRRSPPRSGPKPDSHEKSLSPAVKSTSLPKAGHSSKTNLTFNDCSMSGDISIFSSETQESLTSNAHLTSPSPPPPAFLHEKFELKPRKSATKSVSIPHAASSQIPRSMEESHGSSHSVPVIRKSRSFGSRLKGILGDSKNSFHNKSTADDDTRSILSSKSSFSTRSSSSVFSIASRFGRKNKDTDDSAILMSPSIDPKCRSPSDSECFGLFGTTQRTRTLSSSADSADSIPKPPRRVRSFSPCPPSPALRSGFDYFNDTSRSDSSPVKHSKSEVITGEENPAAYGQLITNIGSSTNEKLEKSNHEFAPSNLAAGDIYPGNLKNTNLEIIVNSVERTGSFKRQPSTKKRSQEEVVPHPQEIESEVKRTPSINRPKASCIKCANGQSTIRRSGASNFTSVSFASQILVYKTYSASAYDRTPDRMTCDMLSTPGVAQRLREELNQWKSLMDVHPESRRNTQYFQF